MKISELKGINFGGWLSQCDYSEEHFNSFISEKDVAAVAGWGMNCIRLPFDYNIFYQDFSPQNKFEIEKGICYLQEFVRWSEKYNITVILDLHKAEGYSFNDKNNGLWTDPVLQKKIIDLWSALGRYFGNKPHIIFELLNEPAAPSTGIWLSFCGKVINSLRNAGINNHLLIESNSWGDSRHFVDLVPFKDDKVIYSFHFYHPVFFTHQNAYWIDFYDKLKGTVVYPGIIPVPDNRIIQSLSPAFRKEFISQKNKQWNYYELEGCLKNVIRFKKKYQQQVLCGEFGVFLQAPRDSQLNWLRDTLALFQQHQFGWCYWNYKNMDYGVVYDQGHYSRYLRYQSKEKTDQELVGLFKQYLEN